MKCILGKKLAMTQVFNEAGLVVPVTAVKVGPCVVTQVRTQDKDGYSALQLGFGSSKRASTKALQGHLAGIMPTEKSVFKVLTEVRFFDEKPTAQRGDVVSLDTFTVGEKVAVTGHSKGKGFAGVVKRHHFHGHPKTHGHKDQLRMPGSIGAGGNQHVFKGVRMGGHMGDEQVTVQNLTVIKIDEETGIMYVKGAVPGAYNGTVLIKAPGELKIMTATEIKEAVIEEVAPVEAETVSEVENLSEVATEETVVAEPTVEATVEVAPEVEAVVETVAEVESVEETKQD